MSNINNTYSPTPSQMFKLHSLMGKSTYALTTLHYRAAKKSGELIRLEDLETTSLISYLWPSLEQ